MTAPGWRSCVIVVADEPELLATFLPVGAQFVFAAGDHGLGPHPWLGRGAWEGHGVLMLQRPGERYAVWHFWTGAERAFAGWYVNLQEPFRRTPIGYDTYDLELDVWMPAGGEWSFKDDDLLDVRVARAVSRPPRPRRSGRSGPRSAPCSTAERSGGIRPGRAGRRIRAGRVPPPGAGWEKPTT